MQKWVFFDLGSTLLNETGRVHERINETAKLLKIDESLFRNQLEQAATTNPYVIHMELPDGAEWVAWAKRLDPLYSDAIPVLESLSKKYQLGIIANHGKDTAKQLKIDKYFTVYAVSESAGYKKPDLHIFQMALMQAFCEPENAVMIGDRLDNDIYPAKKLGMKTIWIKQGFGGMANPQSEEYQADYEINSLTELLRIL
jgi:HAD superfamily hydrolase (TIGR01509 family)